MKQEFAYTVYTHPAGYVGVYPTKDEAYKAARQIRGACRIKKEKHPKPFVDLLKKGLGDRDAWMMYLQDYDPKTFDLINRINGRHLSP